MEMNGGFLVTKIKQLGDVYKRQIIALRVMKDSQNFLTGSFRFSHTHIFQNGRLDETAVLKYERHRIHEVPTVAGWSNISPVSPS